MEDIIHDYPVTYIKFLCSISTRGRYYTTLPLTLAACINQTRKPDHIIIFDDNDPDKRIDIREIEVYYNLLTMMDIKGISWEVRYGDCKGQHFNHQIANTMEGYTWCWRVDDDVIPEPECLNNMLLFLDNLKYTHGVDFDTVGAVGGSIITPHWNLPKYCSDASNKIDDIFTKQNKQWYHISEPEEVDHLHCSFLYRTNIINYNLNLSPKAHREETLFTYGLKQKGFKIYIIPNCVSWHLKSPHGGIRGNS